MKVTESAFKNRQLHIEDYLKMVSAEQKEYAEVFDYGKINEKSGMITGYWTNNLLDLILRRLISLIHKYLNAGVIANGMFD